jgi:hypothetical protein
MHFEIRRDDPRVTRFDDDGVPEPAEGEALLAISRFGLTTNNVTYVIFGDAMNYWRFFPATEEGWGRMPVWGFADVAASGHPGVEAGRRVYGYFPAATHLVVRPDSAGEAGFTDATPHRAELPAIYNRYVFTDADPGYDPAREPEQMLLQPLFGTAFLLDDELADTDFDGAETIVITSASSKTALATAFLLRRREGPNVVGLTSPSRVGFVEETGAYHRVLPYDRIDRLGTESAAFLEFAGNAEVRAAVHRHFGDRLRRSTLIGMTHWESLGGGDDLPGPTPTFFFAPDQAAKRASDWGGAGLRDRMAKAWLPFVEWTGGWLRVSERSGADGLRKAYLDLLDGDTDPAQGIVCGANLSGQT